MGIYYTFISRPKPKANYYHISEMEHAAGFLPCSLSSCSTCYPQAVTEAPRRSYDYNPYTRVMTPKSEYSINSLIQDAYNKEVEMAMRDKIYFDYDPSRGRVSISNGTHGMVINEEIFNDIGPEAVKTMFLEDVRKLNTRNTKWEISSPISPSPLPDPRIEGYIKI
jgi:hypothetical protein